MTFRKLIGLGAIGGLLYAHKRHGGQFTLESFKQSARDLMDSAKTRAQDFRSQAETRLHEAANKVADATDVSPGATKSTGFADDVTGYGSSGYSGTNPNRR